MHLFYVPYIKPQDNTLELSAEESKHCTQVLRMKVGDVIEIVDGKGGYYQAQLSQIHKTNTCVTIIKQSQEYGKKNFELTIAIAPTKNTDRFEWFLEKSTEIGIDKIIPIQCRYSERKEIKTERLKKVIVAAMKQSQKAYCPVIEELTPLAQILKTNTLSQKYIAHCYEGGKSKLQSVYSSPQSALILIGPEGDFSQAEVEEAIKNEYIPITLGSSRLRTETAGIVACHTINMLNNM